MFQTKMFKLLALLVIFSLCFSCVTANAGDVEIVAVVESAATEAPAAEDPVAELPAPQEGDPEEVVPEADAPQEGDPEASAPEAPAAQDESAKPVLYKVTFLRREDPSAQDVLFAYSIAEGKRIPEPVNAQPPVREGYVFSHWYELILDESGEKDEILTKPEKEFAFWSVASRPLLLAPYFTAVEETEVEEGAVEEDIIEETEEATEVGDDSVADDEADEPVVVIEDDDTPLAGPVAETVEDAPVAEPTEDAPVVEEDFISEEEDFIPDAPVALAGPVAEAKVTNDAGKYVSAGDVVTWHAEVIGLEAGEGTRLLTVWRRNAGDGWVEVATDTYDYSFVVNAENFHWDWQFEATLVVVPIE